MVGYGGLGGNGLLSLIALGSGLLLWMKRRSAGALGRFSLGYGVPGSDELAGDGMLGQGPGAECAVHGARDLYVHADGYGWLSYPHSYVYSDGDCKLG